MPTDNPKILHVIARYNIGGTARYLTNLLPSLELQNINTRLVVGRVQDGETEDLSLANLNFTRVESLGRRINLVEDFRSYIALRRIIKEYNPDLIHSHTFKAGFLSRLMFFRIPKVHTFHGHLLTDPEFSKSQVKKIVNTEKILAKFTQKLIVTGQQVATDLLVVGVGKPHQYLSIPGESQLESLLPREIARKNLGLTTEFTILWSARVVAVKNPKLLLEVARMMPDCKFIMAGDGLELESIISDAPPNLMILGFVDVGDILLAGDVFLSTSLNEGVPYSILEAQYVGLPVVATRAGALSELISDGVNGFLVEPSAEQIACRLQELKSKPKLLEDLKSNCVVKSLARQPKVKFSTKHIELYREIMKGRKI